MSSRTELAQAIYRVSNIRGEFRLRSGAVSDQYFDKYLFEADPSLLKEIALAMSEMLPPDTDALAGLELGGVPLATMLSQITDVPALFVRKTAKEYGTCKLAEGGEVAGQNLVVVEDVVTSGGQIILSVEELRNLGAQIATVVCVIERDPAASKRLTEHNLELRPLFTMAELDAAVEQ